MLKNMKTVLAGAAIASLALVSVSASAHPDQLVTNNHTSKYYSTIKAKVNILGKVTEMCLGKGSLVTKAHYTEPGSSDSSNWTCSGASLDCVEQMCKENMQGDKCVVDFYFGDDASAKDCNDAYKLGTASLDLDSGVVNISGDIPEGVTFDTSTPGVMNIEEK